MPKRIYKEQTRSEMSRLSVRLTSSDFKDFEEYCKQKGTSKQIEIETYIKEQIKGMR